MDGQRKGDSKRNNLQSNGIPPSTSRLDLHIIEAEESILNSLRSSLEAKETYQKAKTREESMKIDKTGGDTASASSAYERKAMKTNPSALNIPESKRQFQEQIIALPYIPTESEHEAKMIQLNDISLEELSKIVEEDILQETYDVRVPYDYTDIKKYEDENGRISNINSNYNDSTSIEIFSFAEDDRQRDYEILETSKIENTASSLESGMTIVNLNNNDSIRKFTYDDEQDFIDFDSISESFQQMFDETKADSKLNLDKTFNEEKGVKNDLGNKRKVSKKEVTKSELKNEEISIMKLKTSLKKSVIDNRKQVKENRRIKGFLSPFIEETDLRPRPVKANIDLLCYYAKKEFTTGNFEEAESLYNRAIDLDPYDGRAYLGNSKVRAHLHDYITSREYLMNGLKLSPENPYLLQALGMHEQRQHNYEKALTIFNTCIKTNPKHTAAYVSKGNLLGREYGINSANIASARACYQKAVKIDPSNEVAWHAWGMFERKITKSFKLAATLLAKATEINPRGGRCWHAWAMLEWKDNKNIDFARSLFQRAIRAYEKNGHSYQAWACLEKEQGDYEVAFKLFRKAIDVRPRDGAAYQAYAIARKEVEEFDKAEELFKLGIEKDPYHCPLYQAYGMMLFELSEKSLDYRTYTTFIPENESFDEKKSKTNFFVSKAETVFNQGIKIAPNGKSVASIWQALGCLETKKASLLTEKNIDIDPHLQISIDGKTSSKSQVEEENQIKVKQILEVERNRCFERARKFFRTALLKSNKNHINRIPILVAWAKMEEISGSIESARQIWEKILSLSASGNGTGRNDSFDYKRTFGVGVSPTGIQTSNRKLNADYRKALGRIRDKTSLPPPEYTNKLGVNTNIDGDNCNILLQLNHNMGDLWRQYEDMERRQGNFEKAAAIDRRRMATLINEDRQLKRESSIDNNSNEQESSMIFQNQLKLDVTNDNNASETRSIETLTNTTASNTFLNEEKDDNSKPLYKYPLPLYEVYPSIFYTREVPSSFSSNSQSRNLDSLPEEEILGNNSTEDIWTNSMFFRDSTQSEVTSDTGTLPVSSKIPSKDRHSSKANSTENRSSMTLPLTEKVSSKRVGKKVIKEKTTIKTNGSKTDTKNTDSKTESATSLEAPSQNSAIKTRGHADNVS